MFGPGGDGQAGEGQGVQWSLQELCARAGLRLRVPANIDSLCCGVPWSSKGLPAGERAMKELVTRSVGTVVGGGRVDVISDASSCTEGYLTILRTAGSR